MAGDHDIKAEEARLTSRHPGSVSASLGLVINIGPRTPARHHTAQCALCGEVHRECHSLLTLQPGAQPAFDLFYIFDPIVQRCTWHPGTRRTSGRGPCQDQSHSTAAAPPYSYSVHPSAHLHNYQYTATLLPPLCTCWADVTGMS